MAGWLFPSRDRLESMVSGSVLVTNAVRDKGRLVFAKNSIKVRLLIDENSPLVPSH
jgi:hypothetical protein